MKDFKDGLTEVELMKEAEINAKLQANEKYNKTALKRNIVFFVVGLILTVLFLIYKKTTWFPKINMIASALFLINGISSLVLNIKYIIYSRYLYIDNKKSITKYLLSSIIIILMAILLFFRSNLFYN